MPVKKEEVGMLTKEEKPPTEEVVKPKINIDMNVSADIAQPNQNNNIDKGP